MRILVVEDDASMADAVASALRHATYAVDIAADGETASELAAVNEYDLIVLDWTIPAPSGIELLQGWRSEGMEIPVLMLSGRTEVDDRISGLDTGADDYLVKPFALTELLARVRSLLRRRETPLHASLEADDVCMDRAAHEVTVGGGAIRLTPKEFALLEFLLVRCDQVVTRTDIAEHVWDDAFDPASNVIDVTVHRLRSKLDGDREDRILHTVKGVGYRLRSRRGPTE